MHLTDPHLFAERESALRGTVTYDSLSRVLGHVANAEWQAEQILLTGDLVQDDSATAYEHIATLLEPFGLPVLTVPGNHDVRPMMKSTLPAGQFDYCGSARHGNWLLTGLDSCIHGSAAGKLSSAELTRLTETIAASDAEHILVCLHHPPIPLGSRWLDSVGLENGREFLNVLSESGRVRSVLFGHAHQAFDEHRDGLRILGTPSTCRQFMPQSDNFALDDRPPAYRRIELHADGAVNTELLWLDSSPQTSAPG